MDAIAVKTPSQQQYYPVFAEMLINMIVLPFFTIRGRNLLQMQVEPKWASHPGRGEGGRTHTLVIMAGREEKVAQFSAVAGVDAERATFFLESAAWNLEVSHPAPAGRGREGRHHVITAGS